MNTSLPKLRVENISLSFGGTKALSDVSFEVNEGEIFAIIGPNGAGKTSMLNCVNNFYKPDSGRIYFDDIEFLFNHQFAGELLAIHEFNQENKGVKIDRWYGVRNSRPFPERSFLEKLYVAHDIESASKVVLERSIATWVCGSTFFSDQRPCASGL